MSATTTRTLKDRAGGVRRFLRALANDPTEWELDQLPILDQLQHELDQVRTAAILGLRQSGHTDAQIAAALGISRQAVSKRWPGNGRYVGAAGRYRTSTTTQED